MRGWSDDGFDENHDEHAESAAAVDKLAQGDLEGEIRNATEDDDVAEETEE